MTQSIAASISGFSLCSRCWTCCRGLTLQTPEHQWAAALMLVIQLVQCLQHQSERNHSELLCASCWNIKRQTGCLRNITVCCRARFPFSERKRPNQKTRSDREECLHTLAKYLVFIVYVLHYIILNMSQKWSVFIGRLSASYQFFLNLLKHHPWGSNWKISHSFKHHWSVSL